MHQVTMNPHNTVLDSKRLIGRKFDDPDPDVQADIKILSMVLVKINELTRAADMKNKFDGEKNVLDFDLGGGTFGGRC